MPGWKSWRSGAGTAGTRCWGAWKWKGERAAFQEQCTSTRWGDGNEYDLCIDTGKIGIENAVEMILEYIRFENIF